MDFLAEKRDAIVAVESKFLEPFEGTKRAEFTKQYNRAFERIEGKRSTAESPWIEMFLSLRAEPEQYLFLDAAQLVKHYLGLNHSYPLKRRVLLYLYWEAANAETHLEFDAHTKEVEDFTRRVSGCQTQFLGITYPALWCAWQERSAWTGMAAHIARLRDRYGFAI